MKQHFQLEEVNHFIPLVFRPTRNSEFFVHFSYCGKVFLVTPQLTFRKAYFQVSLDIIFPSHFQRYLELLFLIYFLKTDLQLSLK